MSRTSNANGEQEKRDLYRFASPNLVTCYWPEKLQESTYDHLTIVQCPVSGVLVEVADPIPEGFHVDGNAVYQGLKR